MFNNWTTQHVNTMLQLQLNSYQEYLGTPVMVAPQMQLLLQNQEQLAATNAISDESGSDIEDDEKSRTLFCANLDDRNITEELLYEVFLQAGPVEDVRIPKDGTGKLRTFGFVTYVHKCTIPYAMQLYQGLTLFRRAITIRPQGDNLQTRFPNYDSESHSSMSNRFKNRNQDWVKGNQRKQKNQNRPHSRTPYQRRSGGDSHNGNDYNRRQHSGSRRRSRSRNNSRI